MSILAELKRRNVIRVAVAYLVLSWLVLQVSDVLVQSLELPAVWSKAVIGLLALGFIPLLVFSWIYEMTPEGLKRESEIERDESITAHTAKKLDMAVIVLLVFAIGLFGYDRFVADRAQETTPTALIGDAGQDGGSGVPAATSSLALGVAVLPFTNLSPDPDNAFFASGVHEDVLTFLSRVVDLRVISRTSVQNYADSELSLPAIGRELGVSHVVEGSVRRADDRVRVTVQLIDAATDAHVWSENYDRTLTDIFQIQSEIAQAIVMQVEAELSPEERQSLSSTGAANVRAYDLFIQGRAQLTAAINREEDGDWLGAVATLEQAVRMDPDFPDAWLRLVEACGLAIWNASERAEPCPGLIDEALVRLQAIAPGSVETLIATAMYHYYVPRDVAAAVEILQPVVAAQPNNLDALHFLALAARRYQQWDVAIDAMRRALLLDPANPRRHSVVINILYDRHDMEEAIAAAEVALRRFPEVVSIQRWHAVTLRDGRGDVSEWREIVRNAPPHERLNLDGTDYIGVFDSLEETIAWLDGAETEPGDRRAEASKQVTYGIVYWSWDQPDQALTHLSQAWTIWQEIYGSRDPSELEYFNLMNAAVLNGLLGNQDLARQFEARAGEAIEGTDDVLRTMNHQVQRAYLTALLENPEAGWREMATLNGQPGALKEWEIYNYRSDRKLFRDVPAFQEMIARLDAELAAREATSP